MQAKDLVMKARNEYVELNTDAQFTAAYLAVEELRKESDDPDDELTNYVMNKLLEVARKEGGNMFAGESSLMNEYIFEFYTDYKNLNKKLFKDSWSKYIRGIGDSKPKSETKAPEVNVEAIKKEAIAEYKAEIKAKEEEAKRKKEEEQKAKEEAKKAAEANIPRQTSLFDFM